MAPPSDLDARIAAGYRDARLRMQALAAELDADSSEVAVPACPAWTAHDLVAHVTGIAAELGAGRRPGPEGTQAWVDRLVAERRDRAVTDVVGEWSDVAMAFESMIADRPDRWWGLTYDVLVHEQDLRGAIDRPGERDGDDADLALRLGLRLVESDLASHDLPAFRVVADGVEHVVGEGEPELTLEASTFEAVRLLGSRRTTAELRDAAFTGDLDRYLPGLLHMIPPLQPLGE